MQQTKRRSRGWAGAGWMLPWLLVLSACIHGGAGPRAYSGPAPECGRIEGGGMRSTLTRLGTGFAFAPYDGSLIVNGHVAPDSSLQGVLDLHPARAAAAGAGHGSNGPAQIASVSGKIVGDAATLVYAAPGCAATLTLARVPHGL